MTQSYRADNGSQLLNNTEEFMKKLLFLTTLVLTVFVVGFTGARVNAEALPEMPGEDCVWIWDDSTHTIWAGQHIDAGTIIFSTDGDMIYIDIDAEGILVDVHISIYDDMADVPVTAPPPGQMQYQYHPGSDTFHFETEWEVEYMDDIYILVHVALGENTGDVDVDGETGWGGENPGEGPRWWFYMDHVFTGYWDCPDDPGPDPEPECDCETAYAFFDDDSIPFNEEGKPWGWYAEFMTGTFPLYAGAGQNDINKGTMVGELTVHADGSITYILEEGFYVNMEDEMMEQHFYIGYDVPERVPGLWQTIDPDMENWMYMTFHIVVCGEYEVEDEGPPAGRGR